jgi:hypothetical protein
VILFKYQSVNHLQKSSFEYETIFNKNIIMDSKTSNFSFTIIAIILGVVIYKQFDFDTFKFKNNALAIVYIAAFLLSIYILLKNKQKSK